MREKDQREEQARDIVWHPTSLPRKKRQESTGQRGATIWFTGLSGSGKSSVAAALEEMLVTQGKSAYILDGDNLRFGLNSDLGFSPGDRDENVRRVGEVARLLADSGCVALVPLISPYKKARQKVREMHQTADLDFLEVFVDTPLKICMERDPKGMYKKAQAGEIQNFTGIDDPYETPENPELILKPEDGSEAEMAQLVLQALNEKLG